MFSWSAEHPPLAHRAILTLINHYNSDLVAAERPELASELATMMLDAETPPALRVELASLLRDHHLLSADLLDRLTNLDQPGPMRLFAAELMLRINPHDPDGIDVLRGLARQPNRELAVQIAAVLQSVLGLNLGLPEGELPASNSKQASDIARRVLSWANGANPDILHPTPGPRGGLQTASRHSLPAIGSRASITGIPPMPVPGGTPPPVMPAASVLPMDESAMLPMDESAMIPMRQPAASSSDESAIISSRQPAASPSDESSIIPHRPPSVSPMDESSMIPKEEMPEDTVPVQVPIPPPLPKRPPPRPGSSAVI
jgi:hypothetical protein